MKTWVNEFGVALAIRHAPAGEPTVLNGETFQPGEFIPNDTWLKATPQEKASTKKANKSGKSKTSTKSPAQPHVLASGITESNDTSIIEEDEWQDWAYESSNINAALNGESYKGRLSDADGSVMTEDRWSELKVVVPAPTSQDTNSYRGHRLVSGKGVIRIVNDQGDVVHRHIGSIDGAKEWVDASFSMEALWANQIQRDCLLEAGDDVDAGLAAAEYILATQSMPEDFDIQLGMVGDEWHGPRPPGPGWAPIQPGPRGGKRWKNTGRGAAPAQQPPQPSAPAPVPVAPPKKAKVAKPSKPAPADPKHVLTLVQAAKTLQSPTNVKNALDGLMGLKLAEMRQVLTAIGGVGKGRTKSDLAKLVQSELEKKTAPTTVKAVVPPIPITDDLLDSMKVDTAKITNSNTKVEIEDGIRAYTDGAFTEMNGALREKRKSEYQQQINNFDRAFEHVSHEVRESLTVYRTVHAVPFDIKEGITFQDDGYTSTTSYEDYAHGIGVGVRGRKIFNITIPKGIKVVVPYGTTEPSREVILPRGTKFKVVKMEEPRGGAQVVHLEVV